MPEPLMMKSVVKLRQVSTSEIEVEHPPEWTAEQVQGAATARMPDLLRGASTWTAANSAAVVEIRLGEELDEEGDPYMMPDRDIVLTDDDRID